MLNRPSTYTIRGAASPLSAATSPARSCTTKVWAASAAEPPVVPVPAAAQPSSAARGCRASRCASAGTPEGVSAAWAGRTGLRPRAVTRAAAARDLPRIVRSRYSMSPVGRKALTPSNGYMGVSASQCPGTCRKFAVASGPDGGVRGEEVRIAVHRHDAEQVPAGGPHDVAVQPAVDLDSAEPGQPRGFGLGVVGLDVHVVARCVVDGLPPEGQRGQRLPQHRE